MIILLVKKTNPMRLNFVISLFLSVFIFNQTFAQSLDVNIPNGFPTNWLPGQLQGDDVLIVSANYFGDDESLGVFSDGSGIGLDEGVILSTGKVLDANLPNDELFQIGGDMAVNYAGSALNGFTSRNIYDENIIQIGFIPTKNTIEFEFVFATEEWPIKICAEDHDVFGMLLQGEGVFGFYEDNAEHLGNVPGTMIPINIKNVHDEHPNAETCPARYEEFFEINPIGGSFPYNGYTTVFTAKAEVIPYTVYTLNIMLGDVGNADWDSALFFPKGGLNSYSAQPLSIDMPDAVSIVSSDCEEIELCLPFKKEDVDVNYHLRVDAMQYMGALEDCTYTKSVYSLFNLVIQGFAGPYQLDWMVDGVAYNGQFNTFNELKNLLNEHDPKGHWYFDGSAFGPALAGGRIDGNYSNLTIKQLSTNIEYSIAINIFQGLGTKIFLEEENTVLSITDLQTTRLDVTYLEIECSTPINHTTEIINYTIPIGGGLDLYCQDFNLGFVVNDAENICPGEETNAASFILSGSEEYITISTNELGNSKACFRFCDLGEINCHTKEINIEVIENDEYITWNYTPEDITVECDNIPPPPTDVEASSTCPTGIEVEFYETTAGSCDESFLIYREFRASHDCGYGDTISYRITVYDVHAPEFTVPFNDLTLDCDDPDFELKVNQWVEAASEASDNCNEEVEITYGFDFENLLYTCAQQTSFEIFMTAKDFCDNRTTRSARLYVLPQQGSTTYMDTFYCEMIVGDFKHIDFIDSLPFNPTNLTGECPGYKMETTITESPSVSIDFSPTEAGTAFTCLNVCNEDFTQCAELFILVDAFENINGIAFSNEPLDLDVNCDDIPDAESITAISSCQTGQVTIVFEEIISDVVCDGNYRINRSWTASDVCGNERTITQVLYVYDSFVPFFTTIPPLIEINCNLADLDDQINAWLNDYEVSDACSSVLVTNDFEGYNGDCTAPATIEVTFTATDDCMNFSKAISVLKLVTNVDDDFVFTYVPLDVTVECDGFDSTPNEEPIANSPNCPGTYVYDYSDALIPGTCENEYVIERTWSAADDCGNGITAIQEISVVDNTGPYVVVPPQDLTLSCEDTNVEGDASDWVTSLGYGQYEDACSGEEIIREYNFWPLPDCDNLDTVWTQTYDFYPTDACGNYNVFYATLTILPDLDETGIMITAQLFDLVLQCDDEVPQPLNLSATTDCTTNDEVVISFTETQFELCGEAFYLIRTWDFSDDCGNTEQVTRRIDFVDNFGPIISSFPFDVTVNLEAGETIPEFEESSIVLEDNCGEVSSIVAVDEIAYTIDNGYVIDRTITATDECANETVFVQRITVITADVWPGDTDSTKLVDQFDLFNIGFGFGQTGPARMNPTIDWVGQYAGYWDQLAPDGTNYRHADTDGNGVINDEDTLAVSLNWGLEHEFKAEDDDRLVSPLDLELINVNENGWIRLAIMLGSSNEPMTDFYGLGYAINYDRLKIDPSSVQIEYNTSWVGSKSTDYLTLVKNLSGDGELHSAIVKKNQLGSSGYGKIGELQCKVKDEFLNEFTSLDFTIDLARGVFADGLEFATSGGEETVEVEPVGTNDLLDSAISIYPNPTRENLFYTLSNEMELEHVVLINNAGLVKELKINDQKHLSLKGIPKGIYFLKFYTKEGVLVKKVLVQ